MQRWRADYVVRLPSYRYHYARMIKAIFLMLEPVPSWDRIALARHSLGRILVTYLLPFLLIVGFAEGFALAHWGKWQSNIGRIRDFTIAEAVIYELMELLLKLIIVFISARLVEMIGETFHGRHNYTQAFTVVAYGLGPLFLFHLLDVFPHMNPWISWLLGIVFTIAILYHGVPRVMLPDPPHAFGLYLVSVILLIMTTGLARFITAWYLQGKIVPLQTFIANLASHLSFLQ
jgi:Yip1 domain